MLSVFNIYRPSLSSRSSKPLCLFSGPGRRDGGSVRNVARGRVRPGRARWASADDVSCGCRRRERKRGVATCECGWKKGLPGDYRYWTRSRTGSLRRGGPRSSDSKPGRRKTSAISESEIADGERTAKSAVRSRERSTAIFFAIYFLKRYWSIAGMSLVA